MEWPIAEICERPELGARIMQMPERPADCRLTELGLFVLDAYLIAERRKFLLQLLFEMLLSFFWQFRFFGRSKLRQCFKFSLNILRLNLVPKSVLQLLNIPAQNFVTEDFRSR